MTAVRTPAVAGIFYPAEPATLTAEVDGLLAGPGMGGPRARGLVVPHAAYRYSGVIAARAYRVADRAVRRVVLVGPAHRVPIAGMAVPLIESFATPLGEVPVDPALRDLALAVDCVDVDDEPHRLEHSLEVQLPFLQRILTGFSILPVVVGLASDDQVERLLQAVWDREDTLVVVSTDLSHGLADPVARDRDGATARAIVELRPERLRPGDACGQIPTRGLLRVARARGLRIECLGLATSADAGGPADSVVGYGAFAVHGPAR